MGGEDEGEFLLAGGFEEPVEQGQVFVDLGGGDFLVGEAEDGVRAALDGEGGSKGGDGNAGGEGVAGLVEPDGNEGFERRALVGEGVEVLAGDEHEAAAFLFDEVDEVSGLRGAERGSGRRRRR